MGSVERFRWTLDSTAVSWVDGGRPIELAFPEPPQSAVPLKDGSGVAIVEFTRQIGQASAVIHDADGNERCRLQTELDHRPLWYFQMYYVENELTAFVGWRSGDWAVVVDEQSGSFVRWYETR